MRPLAGAERSHHSNAIWDLLSTLHTPHDAARTADDADGTHTNYTHAALQQRTTTNPFCPHGQNGAVVNAFDSTSGHHRFDSYRTHSQQRRFEDSERIPHTNPNPNPNPNITGSIPTEPTLGETIRFLILTDSASGGR